MPVQDDLTIVLSYYTPYTSGLTNVARDVAEGLAARGRTVTVVTTAHEPNLARTERVNGVRIIRTPVAARIGKGVISPSFTGMARRASRHTRLLNIHAPLLEAGAVAARSIAPVVVTYQCDVSLPPSLINNAQRVAMDASNRCAINRSAATIVSSLDYGEHSRLWSAIEPRVVAIPPTCHDRSGGQPRFRETDGPHIGFLGRIVEEKGVEYLVEGFTSLDDPDARLLIGGDFAAVAGGSVIERVRTAIGNDSRIRMLGFVPDEDLADFYASLDVFALPSVNPFEAFGIVQVEALMCGIPVLASDLPGVRCPVELTGLGVVVERQSGQAVAEGLRQILAADFNHEAGVAKARELYSLESTLDSYENLIETYGTR